MNIFNSKKLYFIVLFIVTCSINLKAQDVDKVLFIKSVPVIMKSQGSYTFKVGYVATGNRDISVELSGGPNKYWAGTTISVNKGQGIKEIQFAPNKSPGFGAGYRLVLSIKPKGGDWRTTIAARVINNLEFVKKDIPFVDDASFSLATPTVVESADVQKFNIDYSVSKPQFIQVSIWDESKWIATSQKITVEPGKGTKKVEVPLAPLKEGDKYKFLLTFGDQEAFDKKTYAQKEISGVKVIKAVKKLTIKEVNEKSIQISLNKASKILTLPGNTTYDFIRIIAMNGQTLIEVAKSNSIDLTGLPQGAYFAITSTDDYYKFVKF
ncbi:Por secretion system C-terminal sorting domain-containing protein [Lutibacter oricola]|uniref:Por secretion system C-terminal sorting domain-containing protein n=1 Tax=Lutibacter oricola TaxID=762486 RepID=A0A1H3AIL9_9FLAO|nr:hypothetical protein [Lutibacter oricola]SDX29463.1 Por secretion system C-terminal sorting domain-containing protein [Lutibacter oricola]